MKRALLALWLIGVILSTTNGASTQSLETASIQSEPADVHSVVVDAPQNHIAVVCVPRSLGYSAVVGSAG
jgi:hypothetical protein